MCFAMDMCGRHDQHPTHSEVSGWTACKYDDGGMDMYIVTIREKGKDKPLLERECDCVIGAFGSAEEADCLTGIHGDRETLISTYASALMGLKKLETEFPGLVDQAVEAVKNADFTEIETEKPHASLFSRLFGR